jgi:hypothetical protein
MDFMTKFELFKVFQDIGEMGCGNALMESCSYVPNDMDPRFTELRKNRIQAIHEMQMYFNEILDIDDSGQPSGATLKEFHDAGYDWSDTIDSRETLSSDSDSCSSMDDFIVESSSERHNR